MVQGRFLLSPREVVGAIARACANLVAPFIDMFDMFPGVEQFIIEKVMGALAAAPTNLGGLSNPFRPFGGHVLTFVEDTAHVEDSALCR